MKTPDFTFQGVNRVLFVRFSDYQPYLGKGKKISVKRGIKQRGCV